MSHKRRRALLSFTPPPTLLPQLSLDVSSLEQSVRQPLTTASAALHSLRASDPPAAEAIATAEVAADAARESTFPFLEEEVPRVEYCSAYAVASLWVAEVALHAASEQQAAERAHRACDLAMLRGGVEEWAALAEPIICAADSLVMRARAPPSSQQPAGPAHKASVDERREELEKEVAQHVSGPLAKAIARVDARKLSVSRFREEWMLADPPVPVVLMHAIDDWPAMEGRRWSLDYVRATVGARLVPVETCEEGDVTRGYMADSWERRVMSLSEYIDAYVLPSQEDGEQRERGYLAQHQLFSQIPSLRRDIGIPSYCSAVTPEDLGAPTECEQRSGDSPLISAWFGPSGSISPLHNDPYHNLLVQVVGFKYVRVYDARHTARLYPHTGSRCNTSRVDLDSASPEKHPLFASTPFHQCILGPGEVLYIPRHAWHYIRAVEISFSVSFWWGAKMGLHVDPDGKAQAFY